MNKRSNQNSDNPKKKSSAQQPWEQSIYDTEYETISSRSKQRRRKRGNTVFLTWLVIMLSLIVAVPALAVYFVWGEGNNPLAQPAPSSSSEESSALETSESSAESSSTKETQSSADQSSDSGYDDTDDSDSDDGTGDYATVQAGDGLWTFAQRNGVTLDDLYDLNDIDDSSSLYPGQTLRIK